MISAQHLLTRREAAEELEMSLRNFDRLRARGEIKEQVASGEPHKRGRRFLRFAIEEVERWKREHRKSESGHSHAEEQPPESET